MYRRSFKLVGAASLLPLAMVLVAASYSAPRSQPVVRWEASAGDSTVLDSIFSETQAKRGEAVFQGVCTRCHRLPEFTIGTHSPTTRFKTVGEMFMTIATKMPQDDPGGLTYPEYAAVVSYILQQNGYPAGKEDLPMDVNKLLPIHIVPAPAAAGR